MEADDDLAVLSFNTAVTICAVPRRDSYTVSRSVVVSGRTVIPPRVLVDYLPTGVGSQRGLWKLPLHIEAATLVYW